MGRGFRGEPPGFQHEQFLAGQPWRIEQRQRNAVVLPAPGWRGQQGVTLPGQYPAGSSSTSSIGRRFMLGFGITRKTVAEASCKKEWRGRMPDTQGLIALIHEAFRETEHPGDAFLQGSHEAVSRPKSRHTVQGCHPLDAD